MYPAGFEPTIQGSERPQIHALDRAATRFAIHDTYRIIIDLSRLISYRMFLFGRSEKLCSDLSVIAMRLAKLQGADKSLARPGRKQATFPAFYGTWRFITTFKTVHQLSLP